MRAAPAACAADATPLVSIRLMPAAAQRAGTRSLTAPELRAARAS
jgi:hypothetical protein